MKINIVGAGLAGLLAAHAWPQAEIFERQSRPATGHRALLRFRSLAVSKLTGIDFQRVQVRKGIWWGDRFVRPDIRIANWYAEKTLGHIGGDRSIWNLDPVERYIAPENFYEQLADSCARRIHWGEDYPFLGASRDITISTAPLPETLKRVSSRTDFDHFHRAPIRVERYRVPDCDAYQTIYFPTPTSSLYRASLTGSMLICESVIRHDDDEMKIANELAMACNAFGFSKTKATSIKPIDHTQQHFGKIVPLPDAQRKALLHLLTVVHNIFSLGRFATWRNILLDDVVQDIDVIRRIMKAGAYELRHFAS